MPQEDPKTRRESKKTAKQKKDGNTGKYSAKHVRMVVNILEAKQTAKNH